MSSSSSSAAVGPATSSRALLGNALERKSNTKKKRQQEKEKEENATNFNAYAPGRNRQPFVQLVLPEWTEALQAFEAKCRVADRYQKYMQLSPQERPLLLYLVNDCQRHCEHRRNFNMTALGIVKDADEAVMEASRLRSSGMIPEDCAVGVLALGVATQIRDTEKPDEQTAMLIPKDASDTTDEQSIEMARWRKGVQEATLFTKSLQDAKQRKRQELFGNSELGGNLSLIEREMDNPDNVFEQVKTSNLPLIIQDRHRADAAEDFVRLMSTNKIGVTVPSNIFEYLFYCTPEDEVY